MSSGWCRWSLGSLLLLLGRNLGIHVKIHQDSVNGTVGESVLLPISYRFDGAPCFPVWILWALNDSQGPFTTCTVYNCSLGARGTPSSCFATCFTYATYQSRTKVFPENGSLLLQNLQLSDSRGYTVTFRPPPQTLTITLTMRAAKAVTMQFGFVLQSSPCYSCCSTAQGAEVQLGSRRGKSLNNSRSPAWRRPTWKALQWGTWQPFMPQLQTGLNSHSQDQHQRSCMHL